MERVAVTTGGAPRAIGPYSQGVRVADLLFCSGQIGLDPATGNMVEGGIVAETERVMENLSAVLGAAGCTFADVVKTTIYLVDLADFGVVNEIYGRYLSEPFPARATVEVKGLPRGARVEIDAVAVVTGEKRGA